MEMPKIDVVWKQIKFKGEDTYYEVSSSGKVRRIGKTLLLTPMRTGRKRKGAQRSKVMICGPSLAPVQAEVGALVLEAFVRLRSPGEVVMHLDDDSANNALSNVRWGTSQENALDCAKKKRFASQRLGMEEVKQIYEKRTAGVPGNALAKEYGVSPQIVCDIFKLRSALARLLVNESNQSKETK